MKTTIAAELLDHTIPSTAETPPISTSNILFVEDDPDLAAALASAFRDSDSADFVIERATTLGAAITLLGSCEIDVILLDLNLPDSRGLCARERKITSSKAR
jgi:DNA-binding response OmpR family regulator